MTENSNKRFVIVLALATSLALAGCVDTAREELGLQSSDTSGSQAHVALTLTAENVPEDIAHMGLLLKGAFLHNASTPAPDGYHPLTLKSVHADLVGSANNSAVVANGSVPTATYDQIFLQLRGIEAEMAGNASSGGHEHAEGEDGDDHAHGEASDSAELETQLNVPINATLDLTQGGSYDIEVLLDVGASKDNQTFTPVIDQVKVTRDGELVDTLTDVTVGGDEDLQAPEAGTGTQPPVARISVFGPDGAKVYDPEFIAEDGDFVNNKANAYPLDATIRFSATESEAVEDGTELTSFAWDFDNGNTSQGPNVEASYDRPGVFEVELEVTDSAGATDTHMVRLVFLSAGWTTMAVNESFEEGAAEYTTSASEDPAGGLTTWALDGPGDGTGTAWHVGTHVEGIGAHAAGVFLPAEGYTPNAEATLTSPAYTIPANWSSAGYSIDIRGSSEACCDGLTVTADAGGNTVQIAQLSGSQDWTTFKDEKGLTNAVGKQVTFTFTFSSDAALEEGWGWLVDNVKIGGVDVDLHKPHLLEEGAGDGHDHEH